MGEVCVSLSRSHTLTLSHLLQSVHIGDFPCIQYVHTVMRMRQVEEYVCVEQPQYLLFLSTQSMRTLYFHIHISWTCKDTIDVGWYRYQPFILRKTCCFLYSLDCILNWKWMSTTCYPRDFAFAPVDTRIYHVATRDYRACHGRWHQFHRQSITTPRRPCGRWVNQS